MCCPSSSGKVVQNEHWNWPKIKMLYSWSPSCEVVIGNFLFFELFNGELFSPAFIIYIFLSKTHTTKPQIESFAWFHLWEWFLRGSLEWNINNSNVTRLNFFKNIFLRDLKFFLNYLFYFNLVTDCFPQAGIFMVQKCSSLGSLPKENKSLI